MHHSVKDVSTPNCFVLLQKTEFIGQLPECGFTFITSGCSIRTQRKNKKNKMRSDQRCVLPYGMREGMFARVHDPLHDVHEVCLSSKSQGKAVKSKINTQLHHRKRSTFMSVYNVQQDHNTGRPHSSVCPHTEQQKYIMMPLQVS